MKNQTNWIPEICYEEESVDGLSSNIPFIPVPQDQEMPSLLYVFESRETGEVEPGPNGEELPVTELDLHQYADMAVLKDKLDSATYDAIRAALGLEPLASASAKGVGITNRVRENISRQTTR